MVMLNFVWALNSVILVTIIRFVTRSLIALPAKIFLFKVNNRSTRKRREICSGVFIVNSKYISHLLLLFYYYYCYLLLALLVAYNKVNKFDIICSSESYIESSTMKWNFKYQRLRLQNIVKGSVVSTYIMEYSPVICRLNSSLKGGLFWRYV